MVERAPSPFVSYQTWLTGSCDGGHSVELVGPRSFSSPGHGGLAAMLCAADRGWPLVSHSCVTSLVQPRLSSALSVHASPIGMKRGLDASAAGARKNISRISRWDNRLKGVNCVFA